MKTNDIQKDRRASVLSLNGNQCVWMKTGRVLFKLCSHNYACKNCAYDQLLDAYEELRPEADPPALAAAQINAVAGFMVSNAYYAAPERAPA